jgi:hypothetical protein
VRAGVARWLCRWAAATAAKHGIGTFNALITLAEGRAWLPDPA